MSSQKTTPTYLIIFCISAALLGGCASEQPKGGLASQPIPPGAAKLSMPAFPVKVDPIDTSREAMTIPQRFNNDVSYELRLIDENLYGDEDVYLYGQYFCTMRETYTAAEVQAKTAESIAASPADQEAVNTTRLNVTYKMAMTTLCPNTKKK